MSSLSSFGTRITLTLGLLLALLQVQCSQLIWVVAVSEYMKHQACLLEASVSPMLVNCSRMLNEYFAIIFNRELQTDAEKENYTLFACQFVILFTRQFKYVA